MEIIIYMVPHDTNISIRSFKSGDWSRTWSFKLLARDLVPKHDAGHGDSLNIKFVIVCFVVPQHSEFKFLSIKAALSRFIWTVIFPRTCSWFYYVTIMKVFHKKFETFSSFKMFIVNCILNRTFKWQLHNVRDTPNTKTEIKFIRQLFMRNLNIWQLFKLISYISNWQTTPTITRTTRKRQLVRETSPVACGGSTICFWQNISTLSECENLLSRPSQIL